VSVDVLHRKSGSASPRRVFRAMLREMIEADALPDYHLEEEPGDILRVTPRDAVIEAAGRPLLAPTTYEVARASLPGWDVYALEAEWRAWWVETGRPRLSSPDKAFLGWHRVEQRVHPFHRIDMVHDLRAIDPDIILLADEEGVREIGEALDRLHVVDNAMRGGQDLGRLDLARFAPLAPKELGDARDEAVHRFAGDCVARHPAQGLESVGKCSCRMLSGRWLALTRPNPGTSIER
jgi:hypothetical protein